MNNQSSISRSRPGVIPLLSLLVCLLFLICIGPGSTQGFAAQVTLAWDANTDPAVAGYKLYYGTASRTYGTPVDVGKVTQYTLTGIQEGVNAYFAVTAYDASRNESAFSTELPCFSLVPAPCVNGSISPSSAVVDSLGMNQTFTITPAANYKVSAVTVDGASVGAVSSYTFSNVTANHTIAASFTLNSNTYTISASAGVNGSISPSGSVSVTQGASQVFTITANTGYQVQNVLVDGASVGAVASYTFSNVTAAHTIAASFVAKTYSISASTGTNGTITPLSASVSNGASQTFTITSNTGYQVNDVLVDNISVGAVTSYTFSNVTATHSIAASFIARTYAVTASAGTNGVINPSGSVVVSYGGSQTFTITPNTGYQVQDVKVDGTSVGAVTSYTLSNVSATHGVVASFVAKTSTYAIEASAGINGSISPSGSVSVTQGTSQVFTITANTGYQVQDVKVDGASVGAVTTYTFTNVTATHSVVASFVAKTYAIAASAGTNGAISPSGSVSVTQGASQIFTITANTGYQVQDVKVDGASVGAVTSYTFSNVTAAHSIAASFAVTSNKYTISASTGFGGSISPSGSVQVTKNASQAFTITANTGYRVKGVTVDGVSVGAVAVYIFSNVTAAHSIVASFEVTSNKYTISASAGTGGIISPSGNVQVRKGSSKMFTITANSGYQVKDVLVDGFSIGAVTSYTFSKVTVNHSISASFNIAALLKLNFDEGSGRAALDSSGSGNSGTISGAVYTTDSAAGSYALSLDGSDRVTVPAKESLKPSDLSVAFWVKHMSDTSTSYGGIIQGAYGGGYSSGFRVLDWQNTPLVQINFGDSAPIGILGNSFVPGEWTHMVLTYDHEKIRLYQNGWLISEVSETRNINWNVNASNLTIGLAQWYFKGMIDNVQMCDYALSPEEIGQLYAE